MIPFQDPLRLLPTIYASKRQRHGGSRWLAVGERSKSRRSSRIDPSTSAQKQILTDSALLVGLRPLILGVAMVIFGATIFRMSTLPFAAGLVTLLIGLLAGGAFLTARHLIIQGRVPPHWAHPIAAALLSIGYLFVLYNLVFRGNDFAELRFVGLTMVVIMIGALFLRLRWLIGMMTLIFGSWAVANIAIGLSLSWEIYLVLFPIIGVASLANFAARTQAISRMIDTQLENDLHNAQLAEALERAHLSEAQLKVERDLADQIVESMAQGLVLVDDRDAVEYVNPAAENILGMPAEVLIGQSATGLFQSPGNARHGGAIGESFHARSRSTREVVVDRADGQESHVLVSTKSRESGGFILSLTDLTLRKRFESRLQRLAHYDALTGLANRALLELRIQQALDRLERRRSHIALLFLDIDQFKPINDTAGHAVGDQVLIEIANRIQESVRDHDTAARIGGDEFIVLLDGVDDTDLALKIADRIAQCIREPVVVESRSYTVSVSIGIVTSESSDAEPDDLIHFADTAMYEAKRRNGVTRILYSAEDGASARQVA